jgi:hypothetical protein
MSIKYIQRELGKIHEIKDVWKIEEERLGPHFGGGTQTEGF